MTPELQDLGGDVAEAGAAGACIQCAIQLGIAPETAVLVGVGIVMTARTALAVYRLWSAWRATRKAARADAERLSASPATGGNSPANDVSRKDPEPGDDTQPPGGVAGPEAPH